MNFTKKLNLLVLLLSVSAFAQIDKIEPPFWYAGMHNPELQIMFYGKNIAQYEASVSNNVVIKNVVKTENPNYIFITIDTKNIPASDFVFSFKNKNKVAFTKKYTLKARRKNSAQRKSFDSSDLIYLIMPDRFANGNPNNDTDKSLNEKADRSLPGGRHGGDIEGIIKHLDYLEELGVTAIWSTPLCEDNDKVHSYHTYGQSDVYKIDPRYGTNEEYVRLSAELKKRNMKLIKDYVTNHWGAEHWMYKDLPTYDWIHQFPGFSQSNYRMTTQFDTNAAAIDAKNCMDGWFVPSMPDLNQSNPLVLNYLIQNAIWWIEYADLDGFRVDTYSYNDKIGIAKWTKAITDEYPYFNIVGEVWMHDQAQMSYWQKDSPISAIQSYNSYLPSVMDFTLHDAFGNVFNEDKATWNDGMIKVYDNFANDFLYPNVNNLLTFVENHDTGRFNHIYKNDFRKYQMAMALIATVRGIPQIYYGSEIGMAGDKGKGDADIRQDFPGGWTGDKNNAFTKAGRTEEQAKFFDFSSKLFQWRKGKSVIHSGKMTHYIPEDNVYVYFRYNDNETVMVIINNAAQPKTFKTARFQENIKDFTSGKDVLTGKSINVKEDISIEEKSVLILELK
ncbi:MAG: glycoside hydrolase family 13 protein [Flavobacterium lindanitolerans]|uniref:glycoside hydrolase family 13 protein n=1 Tax=Flavobacterium lindanitolerans TaxID=428988 RepID=UPI001A4597D6|nr:glycoside hydrolase family 13 protein [Flavobacterium lindanitolerans]MBL7868238.1 glycoside hydrolase family 13 protein [Flavobacterium lindanitolerans]